MLYLITGVILMDLQAEVLYVIMLFCTFKMINKLLLKVICMRLTGIQYIVIHFYLSFICCML